MMMGININCKERDFVSDILAFRKTHETRRTPSLRPYVGKRVGLVRTGVGRAVLCGFATVVSEEKLTESAYNRYRGMLLCTRGTSYENNRYAYRLADVEAVEPRMVTSKGIVARRI